MAGFADIDAVALVSEDALCCGDDSEVGTVPVFRVIGSVVVDDAAGVVFSKADSGVAEGMDDSEGLGTGVGVICVVVPEVGIGESVDVVGIAVSRDGIEEMIDVMGDVATGLISIDAAVAGTGINGGDIVVSVAGLADISADAFAGDTVGPGVAED